MGVAHVERVEEVRRDKELSEIGFTLATGANFLLLAFLTFGV
jgi:hypothetical protein